jgi:hypothetical protein
MAIPQLLCIPSQNRTHISRRLLPRNWATKSCGRKTRTHLLQSRRDATGLRCIHHIAFTLAFKKGVSCLQRCQPNSHNFMFLTVPKRIPLQYINSNNITFSLYNLHRWCDLRVSGWRPEIYSLTWDLLNSVSAATLHQNMYRGWTGCNLSDKGWPVFPKEPNNEGRFVSEPHTTRTALRTDNRDSVDLSPVTITDTFNLVHT